MGIVYGAVGHSHLLGPGLEQGIHHRLGRAAGAQHQHRLFGRVHTGLKQRAKKSLAVGVEAVHLALADTNGIHRADLCRIVGQLVHQLHKGLLVGHGGIEAVVPLPFGLFQPTGGVRAGHPAGGVFPLQPGRAEHRVLNDRGFGVLNGIADDTQPAHFPPSRK